MEAETLTSEAIPLIKGADGVIRLRGTRVTLDTVVAAFLDGATAEEIAQQYPAVALADIYQVIGYYLRHETELEEYFLAAGRAWMKRNAPTSLAGRRMESASVCSPVARGNYCAGWQTRLSTTTSFADCSAEIRK